MRNHFHALFLFYMASIMKKETEREIAACSMF